MNIWGILFVWWTQTGVVPLLRHGPHLQVQHQEKVTMAEHLLSQVALEELHIDWNFCYLMSQVSQHLKRAQSTFSAVECHDLAIP